MLLLSSSIRYFLFSQPVDVRYGRWAADRIYSLEDLVQNGLKLNPLSGNVFAIIGKRGQSGALATATVARLPYSKRPHLFDGG